MLVFSKVFVEKLNMIASHNSIYTWSKLALWLASIQIMATLHSNWL